MSLSRDLTGPGQSRAIRDVLEGLLAAELIRPSAELWLLSAWITDVEILDNSTRAFTSLRPDWPAAPIRLTQVLQALVARGGRVLLVVRTVDHNADFLDRLRRVQRLAQGRLGVATSPEAHDKGLVGDDFVLSGSMNLTHHGLTVNDEHVLLRVDREAAASRRLALHNRWDPVLQWG
jgi:phosphatidylserine/phosphatidylglycerophosphate/cardiolipin synthase-like enzyme